MWHAKSLPQPPYHPPPPTHSQAAASCALERRKCAEKLCLVVPPDGGDTQIDGQPWRRVAADLGIKAEADAWHDSSIVIELLTNGYEHFKERRYQRMILFIASQTAEVSCGGRGASAWLVMLRRGYCLHRRC